MSAGEVVVEIGPRVRPLRRLEYDRLVSAGVFGDERIELLEGVLVEMSPQDPAHAEIVHRLARLIGQYIGSEWQLRVQAPLALGEASAPEPDLAVVAAGSYLRAHPGHAALVVEVARTSQKVDLGPKVDIYARGGVPEYWVVDVADGSAHVHRSPGEHGYADVEVVRTATLTSAEVEGVVVDLTRLFAET